MRTRWLASVASLVVVAGLARAQAPLTKGTATWYLETAPPALLPSEPGHPVSTFIESGQSAKKADVPAAPPAGAEFADHGSPLGVVWQPSDYVDVSRRFWFQGEYLLWFINDGELPMVAGTAAASEVLGSGGGNIQTITPLYGGGARSLTFDDQSGVRLTAGFFLDEDECFGIEGNWFELEDGSQAIRFRSPGTPIIGPTFFDPVQGRDVIVLASLPFIPTGGLAPGLREARIDIAGENRMWGFEVNGRSRLGALLFADRLELIAGYRHLEYEEGLSILTVSRPLPDNEGAFALAALDSFSTRNQYHGGQIGLSSRTYLGPRLTLDLTGKIGLGNMHQKVDIGGATLLAAEDFPTTVTPGGILTQPTNMRGFTRDSVAMLGELTATLGFQVTEGIRLAVGYNYLYVGRVQRASDQIDTVDSRAVQALGSYDPSAQTTRPSVLRDNTSRLWAHGLNAVIEIAY